MSDKISISNETLSVLKALFNVDMTLKICSDDVVELETEDGTETKTVLRVKSPNNTMMCKVLIDEVFPRDVHIYDIREFISVFNIVNEPQLDLSQDNVITILSKDSKQKLRYREAEEVLITSYVGKDVPIANEDLTFDISAKLFDSVFTAAQTMKLEFLGFSGDGTEAKISAFGKNEGKDSQTNSFDVKIDDTDKTFNMFYKLDVNNLKVLSGEGDLYFTIDGGKKVSRIETETGKTFWITMDNKSEYEE